MTLGPAGTGLWSLGLCMDAHKCLHVCRYAGARKHVNRLVDTHVHMDSGRTHTRMGLTLTLGRAVCFQGLCLAMSLSSHMLSTL